MKKFFCNIAIIIFLIICLSSCFFNTYTTKTLENDMIDKDIKQAFMATHDSLIFGIKNHDLQSLNSLFSKDFKASEITAKDLLDILGTDFDSIEVINCNYIRFTGSGAPTQKIEAYVDNKTYYVNVSHIAEQVAIVWTITEVNNKRTLLAEVYVIEENDWKLLAINVFNLQDEDKNPNINNKSI